MKRRTFLHAVSSAGALMVAGVGQRLLHPESAPLRSADVVRPDAYIPLDQYPVFDSVYDRLGRLQSLVGHGNFNVLGFDAARRYARHYASVGEFTTAETAFLEALFETNAEEYGFLGNKVSTRLTETVPEDAIVNVDRRGHHLFRGEAITLYERMRKDVGDSIIVTSGVRSILKQTHLFLAKARRYGGNLTWASEIIAPPGHSYHSAGDFDVGKAGFGRRNFSADFASTEEFRKLADLGYVSIRYSQRNNDGVRYEPWHIKVV